MKENERLRENVKEKHRALGEVRREGEVRRVRLEELERECARCIMRGRAEERKRTGAFVIPT